MVRPAPPLGPTICALLLLCLAGCSGGERYRYVDVQAHPAQAAQEVAARAYELGYEVGPMRTDPRMGFDLYEVNWLTEQASGPEEQPKEQAVDGAAPPEGETTTPAPETAPQGDPPQEPEPIEGLDYEWVPVATVEVHPTEAGSRVGVHSELFDAAGLKILLPGDSALSYETCLTSNPITSTLAWDLVSHLGWHWTIDEGADGHIPDLDASLRLGGRLLRFGGGDADPAPAYSLALLGGLGVGFGPDGMAFRPSVVLSLDRQETASPVSDLVLATGQRYSLDLSAEAVLGDEARGLIGRIELRHADSFGFYLSAGYQFAPQASPLISLGLTLGPMPMAAAGAMLLYVL